MIIARHVYNDNKITGEIHIKFTRNDCRNLSVFKLLQSTTITVAILHKFELDTARKRCAKYLRIIFAELTKFIAQFNRVITPNG